MSLRPRALPADFIAPCLPADECPYAFRRRMAARDQARRLGFRVIARKNGKLVRLL
jgi:hypothetical protein